MSVSLASVALAQLKLVSFAAGPYGEGDSRELLADLTLIARPAIATMKDASQDLLLAVCAAAGILIAATVQGNHVRYKRDSEEHQEILEGDDWCSCETGHYFIKDEHLVTRRIFLSVTRDGSVWLRLGVQHMSLDWTPVNEGIQRFRAIILTDEDLALLHYFNYTKFCALTDIDMKVEANTGWHPSYLRTFDPQVKETKVLYFKQKRDCLIETNITLTPDKQKVKCDGGTRNSCGLKDLPARGRTTQPLFLESVTFDPTGENSWICKPDEAANVYTFVGSYYHAYVKLASCSVPLGSTVLGYEARLRSEGGEEENMAMIPDPSQTALKDGWIIRWKVFAKQVSPYHKVDLQLWRPTPSDPMTFTLQGQTHFSPVQLGYQEIVLKPGEYFRAKKGDVLGLHFKHSNPIAYSKVPCSESRQLYRYTGHVTDMQTGDVEAFRQATLDSSACRHYSVTAVFANKSDSKLLEDWKCPKADIATEDRRQVKGRETETEMNVAPAETTTKKNKKLTKFERRRNSKGPSIPVYIILVIIGVLVLLLVIVGFVSYYQAVKS